MIKLAAFISQPLAAENKLHQCNRLNIMGDLSGKGTQFYDLDGSR